MATAEYRTGVLNKDTRVCLSLIFTDQTCAKQSSNRLQNSDVNHPSMANSVIVSTNVTTVSENTFATPKDSKTFIRSAQGKPSPSRNYPLTNPGLGQFRVKAICRNFRRICHSYCKCKKK